MQMEGSRLRGWGCASVYRIFLAGDLPSQFLHADATMPQSHGLSRGQDPRLYVHVRPRDNPGV
jgi:hypothetical protein